MKELKRKYYILAEDELKGRVINRAAIQFNKQIYNANLNELINDFINRLDEDMDSNYTDQQKEFTPNNIEFFNE